jgi:hypothetical protein
MPLARRGRARARGGARGAAGARGGARRAARVWGGLCAFRRPSPPSSSRSPYAFPYRTERLRAQVRGFLYVGVAAPEVASPPLARAPCAGSSGARWAAMRVEAAAAAGLSGGRDETCPFSTGGDETCPVSTGGRGGLSACLRCGTRLRSIAASTPDAAPRPLPRRRARAVPSHFWQPPRRTPRRAPRRAARSRSPRAPRFRRS